VRIPHALEAVKSERDEAVDAEVWNKSSS